MFDDKRGSLGPGKILKPNCSATWWQSVAIVVWRNETLAEDVRAVSAMLSSADRPHGIALLQVVEPSFTSVNSEARAALSEMLVQGRSYIRFSAVVFCGTGFKAAAVRAIATGLGMVVRRGFPHEVFAGIEEACGRLIANVATPGRSEPMAWDLVNAVERARKCGTDFSLRASARDQSAPSF
jgi:hypothetical protein